MDGVAVVLRGGGNGLGAGVARRRQRPYRCQIGRGLCREVTGVVERGVVVGGVACESVGDGGVVAVGELVVGVVGDE